MFKYYSLLTTSNLNFNEINLGNFNTNYNSYYIFSCNVENIINYNYNFINYKKDDIFDNNYDINLYSNNYIKYKNQYINININLYNIRLLKFTPKYFINNELLLNLNKFNNNSLLNLNKFNYNLYQTNDIQYDVYINRPDIQEYPELIYFYTESNINIITNNYNIISNINSSITDNTFKKDNTTIIPGYNYTLFINKHLVYNYGINNSVRDFVRDSFDDDILINKEFTYHTIDEKTQNIYFTAIHTSYDHNEIQNMLETVPSDTQKLNIFIGSTSILYSLQGAGLEINFQLKTNLQNIERVNIINNGKIYGYGGEGGTIYYPIGVDGFNGINITNNGTVRIINVINNGNIYKGGKGGNYRSDYTYRYNGYYLQSDNTLSTYTYLDLRHNLDINKDHFSINGYTGKYWNHGMVSPGGRAGITIDLRSAPITKIRPRNIGEPLPAPTSGDYFYYYFDYPIGANLGFYPDILVNDVESLDSSIEIKVYPHPGGDIQYDATVSYNNNIIIKNDDINNFLTQTYDFNVEVSGLYYDILIVAGGGAGESSYSNIYPGGGGAGGGVVLIRKAQLDQGNYTITVGKAGGHSSFSTSNFYYSSNQIRAEPGGNGGSEIGQSFFNQNLSFNTGSVKIRKIIISGISGTISQGADLREFEFFGLTGGYANGDRRSIITVSTNLNTSQYPFTPVVTPQEWVSGGNTIYAYNGVDNSLYLLGTQTVDATKNFTFEFTGGNYPLASSFTGVRIFWDRPTWTDSSGSQGTWTLIIEDQNAIQHTMITSFELLQINGFSNSKFAYIDGGFGSIIYPSETQQTQTQIKFKSNVDNVFYFDNRGGLLDVGTPGGGGGAGDVGGDGDGDVGGIGGDGISESIIDFKTYFNITNTTIGEHKDGKVYFGRGGNGGNIYNGENGGNVGNIIKISHPISDALRIQSHSMVAIGSYIFIYGGLHHNSSFTYDNIADLHIINTNANKFSAFSKIDLSDARFGHSMVAIDNDIYIFGGAKVTGVGQRQYYNTFYKIDTTNEIIDLEEIPLNGKDDLSSNIPPQIYYHSMVAIQSNIYIFGGGDGSNDFNDLYKIDINNNNTSEKITLNGKDDLSSNIPTVREGHSMVAIDNHIYIFGGIDITDTTNNQYFEDFYKIDINTNYTSEKITLNGKDSSSDNIPTERADHTMVAIDNHIYIFGGGSANALSYNDLYKIDINNNYTSEKITLNGDIPSQRYYHSMVAIDRNIYIVGGEPNITNDLFIIPLNIENDVSPNTGNDVSPNTGNGGNGGNVRTGIFNLYSSGGSGGSGGSGIVIIRKSEIDPSKLYLYKILLFDGLNIDNAASGYNYSIFLNTSNNLVYSTGKNEFGQLGLDHNSNILIPTEITTLTGSNINFVVCGYSHSIFLDISCNLVYSCGNNQFGQLGLNHNSNILIPTEITTLTSYNIDKVVCGDYHTIFLNTSNNLVYSCGNNRDGQLGLGHYSNISIPTEITTLTNCNINKVVCGNNYTVFLNSKNNLVYYCGNSNIVSNLSDNNIPQLITSLNNLNINTAVCGNSNIIFYNKNPIYSLININTDLHSNLFDYIDYNHIYNLDYLSNLIFNIPVNISDYIDGGYSSNIEENSTENFRNKKIYNKSIEPINSIKYNFEINSEKNIFISFYHDLNKNLIYSMDQNLNDFIIFEINLKLVTESELIVINKVLSLKYNIINNNYYLNYDSENHNINFNINIDNNIIFNIDLNINKLSLFINNIENVFNLSDDTYNYYDLIFNQLFIYDLKIFNKKIPINLNFIKYISDIYLITDSEDKNPKIEIFNKENKYNKNKITEYFYKYKFLDNSQIQKVKIKEYNNISELGDLLIYNNTGLKVPNLENLKIWRIYENKYIIELKLFNNLPSNIKIIKNGSILNVIYNENGEIIFDNLDNYEEYQNFDIEKLNISYDYLIDYKYDINNYVNYNNLLDFNTKNRIYRNTLNFIYKNSIDEIEVDLDEYSLDQNEVIDKLEINKIIYKNYKYYFGLDKLSNVSFNKKYKYPNLEINNNTFYYLNNFDIENIYFINNHNILKFYNENGSGLEEILYFKLNSNIELIFNYNSNLSNICLNFKLHIISNSNIDISVYINDIDRYNIVNNNSLINCNLIYLENYQYLFNFELNIYDIENNYLLINFSNIETSNIILGIYDFKIKENLNSYKSSDNNERINKTYLNLFNNFTHNYNNELEYLKSYRFYIINNNIFNYQSDTINSIDIYEITNFSKRKLISSDDNDDIIIKNIQTNFYVKIDRLSLIHNYNDEIIIIKNIDQNSEFYDITIPKRNRLVFQLDIKENNIRFTDLINTFNSENNIDERNIFIIDIYSALATNIDRNLGNYYGYISNNKSIRDLFYNTDHKLKEFKINYSLLINENIPKFNQFNIDTNFIITTISKPIESILNIVFDYSKNIVYFNTGLTIYRFFYQEEINNIKFTNEKIIYNIDFNNDDNEFIYNIKLSKNNNYLILSDYFNNTIKLLTLKNNYLYIIGGTFNIAGNISIYSQVLNKYISRIYRPTDLVIKNNNNIIFIDSFNGSIKEIEYLTNTISIITGPTLYDDDDTNWINLFQYQSEFKHNDNIVSDRVRFNNPKSIAINKNNDLLYIADTANNCIRLVYLSGNNYGKTETIIGQPYKEGDSPINDINSIEGNKVILNSPEHIAISNDNKYLFICDTNNNSIKYTELIEPYYTKRIINNKFFKPNYIVHHPKGYFIINDKNNEKLYLLYFNNSLLKSNNQISFSDFKFTKNSDNFTINKYISSGNIENNRIIENKIKIENFNINLNNMTKLSIGNDNRYILIYDDKKKYDNILDIKIYIIDTIYDTIEPILNKDYFIFDRLDKVNLDEFLIPDKRDLTKNPIYYFHKNDTTSCIEVKDIYKNTSVKDMNFKDNHLDYHQLYYYKTIGIKNTHGTIGLRFNVFDEPQFQLLHTNIFVINDKMFDLFENILDKNNIVNTLSKLIGDTLIFSLYSVKDDDYEFIIPLISLKNNKLIKLFDYIVKDTYDVEIPTFNNDNNKYQFSNLSSNKKYFADIILDYDLTSFNPIQETSPLFFIENNKNKNDFEDLFCNIDDNIYKSEFNIINLKNDNNNNDNDNCFEITLSLIDNTTNFLKKIYFFRFILTDIDITSIEENKNLQRKLDHNIKDKINEFNLNLSILTLYNDTKFIQKIYNIDGDGSNLPYYNNALKIPRNILSIHLEYDTTECNLHYPGIFVLNKTIQTDCNCKFFDIVDYNLYISIKDDYEIEFHKFDDYQLNKYTLFNDNDDFNLETILNTTLNSNLEKNTTLLINNNNNIYEINLLNINNDLYLNFINIKVRKENSSFILDDYKSYLEKKIDADYKSLKINEFPVYIDKLENNSILELNYIDSLIVTKDLSSIYILNNYIIYKLKLNNNLIIDIPKNIINFNLFTLTIHFNLFLEFINLKIKNDIEYDSDLFVEQLLQTYYTIIKYEDKIYENDYLEKQLNSLNYSGDLNLSINFNINIDLNNYTTYNYEYILLHFIFDKKIDDDKIITIKVENSENILNGRQITLYSNTENFNIDNQSDKYILLNQSINLNNQLKQRVIDYKITKDININYDEYILNYFNHPSYDDYDSIINLKIKFKSNDDGVIKNIYTLDMNDDGNGKEPIILNLNNLFDKYEKLKYLTLIFEKNIALYGSGGKGVSGLTNEGNQEVPGIGGSIINIIYTESKIISKLYLTINFETNKLYSGGDGQIGKNYISAQNIKGLIINTTTISRADSLINSVIYGVSHEFGRFDKNYVFSIHLGGRSFWFRNSDLNNNYTNYRNKPNTTFKPPIGNDNEYDLKNETIISYDINNHFKIIHEYSANVIKNDYSIIYKYYTNYYGIKATNGGTENINGRTETIQPNHYLKYWRIQKVNFSKPVFTNEIPPTLGDNGSQYNNNPIKYDNKEKIKYNDIYIENNSLDNDIINIKINYNNN